MGYNVVAHMRTKDAYTSNAHDSWIYARNLAREYSTCISTVGIEIFYYDSSKCKTTHSVCIPHIAFDELWDDTYDYISDWHDEYLRDCFVKCYVTD